MRKLALAVLLLLCACNADGLDQDIAVTGSSPTPATATTVSTRPSFTIPTTTTSTTQAPVIAQAATKVVPAHLAPGAVSDAIARWFGDVPSATVIAECESHLNPHAISATNDHGLFQIHAPLWVTDFQRVTGKSFYGGVYDPYANAQFARWLYDRSGWTPWSCSTTL